MKYSIAIVFAMLAVVATLVLSMRFVKASDSALKSDYTIKKTWWLPSILDEVSGISWISENTIACVQDEDGIIFIYDLSVGKIVEQISFGGPGDYEGIAIYNKDAYVMRSDGVIFEILSFQESNKKVSKFQTGFSTKNNMETLALDAKREHLITTPKDRDLDDDSYKWIYHIPINSMKMNAQPGVRINMNDGAFESYKKKKDYRTFSPSDAAIHPITGKYYVLEGKKPKLVILDEDGTIVKVYKLDTDNFPQPEGITFSSKGTLYISSEGKHGTASIMEVEIVN